MPEDLSITYNAKLLEVKDNMKQLEKLNFDVSKYAKEIEKIEEETKRGIEASYQTFDKESYSTFLHDSNAQVYGTSITRIDKINRLVMEEYNSYYKITVKCKNLKKQLRNKNYEDIDSLVAEAKTLLKDIRTSSTIDYEMERRLVESIYEAIYKVLKLEIVLNNSSSILEQVKIDETDTAYLIRLIKADIQKLNKEDGQEIRDKVSKLEEQGLDDSSLLNRDLILLLTLSNDEDLSCKAKSHFIESLENHQEISDVYTKVKVDNEELLGHIEDLKKESRKNFLIRLRKKVFLALNLGMIGAGIVGSFNALKDVTKTKEYKTITTTYDSSTDEEKSDFAYEANRDDEINLVEYSPWDTPGYFRDEYERNVYEYNLSGVDATFSNLEAYLTSDIKDDVTYTSTVETAEETPTDLGYTENKYVLTEIKQDKEDFHLVQSYPLWALTTILSSAGILGIDALLIKLLSKNKLHLLRVRKKELKQELKDSKQRLLETKTTLADLDQQCLESREKTLAAYENLPEAVKKSKDVKEKVLTLQRNENNS